MSNDYNQMWKGSLESNYTQRYLLKTRDVKLCRELISDEIVPDNPRPTFQWEK